MNLIQLIQYGSSKKNGSLSLSYVYMYISLSLSSSLCPNFYALRAIVLFAKFNLHLQLYLTDLATRESVLLCTKEHPISQLALHDDGIWVATTDSSVHMWPAEVRNPQKVFQRGGSFLAGNLSFSRARVSLEGSTPVSFNPFISFSHVMVKHTCNCICLVPK